MNVGVSPEMSGTVNQDEHEHLEYLKRAIQHIKYLWIGVAMEWNNDSWGDRFAHHANLVTAGEVVSISSIG